MKHITELNGQDLMIAQVERRFELIRKNVLCPAFRKVALTYCVAPSDFYDTVHEMEFSLSDMIEGKAYSEKHSETGRYVRTEEMRKSNHRLNNLLSRLVIENDPCLGEASMKFFLPKVFDARLSEAMLFTFQSISDLLGDGFFASNAPVNHLRAVGIDGRDKFAFPEYAALCCLYIAINGPAVRTLNRPIETANQLKRAKPRMQGIRDVLFDKKYCRVITKTVFDLMAAFHEAPYNDILRAHLSEFWLKPEKQHLKTVDYAIQRHTVDQLDEGRLFSGNDADQALLHFFQQYDEIELMQYAFDTVFPVAEGLATKAIPYGLSADADGAISIQEHLLGSAIVDEITKEHIERQNRSSFCINECDYMVAAKVADIVTTFVKATQRAVVMLLECLPESSIAGDMGLWDYFNTI